MKNKKDSFDILESISKEFVQEKISLANSYEAKIIETILPVLENFEMGDSPVELYDAWIDDSGIWFIIECTENDKPKRICYNNDELRKLVQKIDEDNF